VQDAAMSHPNRVAVITGASRGIGAGLAEAFAAEGLKLGLCARSIEDSSSESRLARSLDVRDRDAVDAFALEVTEKLGPIGLWINNAGILAPISMLRDVSSSEFEEHLGINVIGVVNGSRTYVNHVRKTGGPGVLVNISSGAGRHGYAGWSAYCAGKAAVDRLSECIAIEEADSNLRVHAVAPGVIDTDMQALIRKTPVEHFPMVQRLPPSRKRSWWQVLQNL